MASKSAPKLLKKCRITTTVLPDFLLPAYASRTHSRRPLSTSPRSSSRIGSAPISIPDGVDVRILEPTQNKTSRVMRTEPPRIVEIQGPLGKLSHPLAPYMTLDLDPSAQKASLSILSADERTQRAMWGTTRAYLANHIQGVSEGHTAILRLVGVGFRASVEESPSQGALTRQKASRPLIEYPGQKFLNLKLGFATPIEMGIPMGVKASCPQPTRVLLEGVEKEIVMQFAAKIRAWRKPEPYKGKGIFVNDETIKLKAKKIK